MKKIIIKDGYITVSYRGRLKMTILRDGPPEVLARILALELEQLGAK